MILDILCVFVSITTYQTPLNHFTFMPRTLSSCKSPHYIFWQRTTYFVTFDSRKLMDIAVKIL